MRWNHSMLRVICAAVLLTLAAGSIWAEEGGSGPLQASPLTELEGSLDLLELEAFLSGGQTPGGGETGLLLYLSSPSWVATTGGVDALTSSSGVSIRSLRSTDQLFRAAILLGFQIRAGDPTGLTLDLDCETAGVVRLGMRDFLTGRLVLIGSSMPFGPNGEPILFPDLPVNDGQFQPAESKLVEIVLFLEWTDADVPQDAVTIQTATLGPQAD